RGRLERPHHRTTRSQPADSAAGALYRPSRTAGQAGGGSAMKQWLCVLMGLVLFLGMAAQAPGQLSYSFTTLNVPGSSSPSVAVAYGINDSGQIAGSYRTPGGGNGSSLGFLLENGSYAALGPPGTLFAQSFGINASGLIVGVYDTIGKRHGFLFDQGTY